MEIDLFPIFRQKTGKVYHFDVLAIDNDFKNSTTVGFVAWNVKSGKKSYSFMQYVKEDTIFSVLGSIDKQIKDLEIIYNS